MRLTASLLLVCSSALTLGCGDSAPPRKPVAKVFGKVTVDGVPPVTPIKIECISVQGVDQANPTFSRCMTETGGGFEISTYEKGDGVPGGDYALTFFWGEMNLITRSFGGDDKLGNRYDTVEKSPVKFSVKSNDPIDLGVIDLKTK